MALVEDCPKLSMVEVKFIGHEIPDWFSYKKIANGNSCELDIIDLPNLEGEIGGSVFGVVAGQPLKETCIDLICYGLKNLSEICFSLFQTKEECPPHVGGYNLDFPKF